LFKKIVSGMIIMLLAVGIGSTSKAGTSNVFRYTSTEPVVRFEPQSLSVSAGQMFPLRVLVENVSLLYGFDIQITWNTTCLKYINHTGTVPVETYPDGLLHEPVMWFKNIVNETGVPGAKPETRYWISIVSMIGAPSFNGSGSAFTMMFKALNFTGTTTLDFTNIQLADVDAQPILYTSSDCVVEMIPHSVHNIDTGLDYATIQEAINAPETGNGHTIFVEVGTYFENVTINKTVSLIGEDKYTTIIDGNNETTPITILASGINLSGFTLRNSSKLDPWFNDGTDGLYLEASSCTISHNIFSGNARGIRMYNSMNNTFYKNIITDNWADGFLVAGYCGGNTLDSNNVSNNGLGIVLYRNGYNNVLRNNEMMDNSYNFMVDPENPDLLDVDSSNTVDGKPIYYWVGEHDRRIPEDAGYVAIINSVNLVVENLALMNNGGVLLYNSRNCSIRGVNIFNSLNGIMLYRSENCTIVENTIVGCKQFLLCHSGFGIFLNSSKNNRFYHNNIIDNECPALICKLPWESYPNTWDNGCEGNYWSDYNDTDSDGDGIGDVPYVIDENNTDNYPLMNLYWNPGDIDHDLDVDLYDAIRLLVAYGSKTGNEKYNCHCDIAEPYEVIDLYDAVLLLVNYGKKYS
jgi:parallel beta-helix repeat protein